MWLGGQGGGGAVSSLLAKRGTRLSQGSTAPASPWARPPSPAAHASRSGSAGCLLRQTPLPGSVPPPALPLGLQALALHP